MRRRHDKRYGSLYRISSVLGILIAVSALVAVILIIWSWQKNQNDTIEALSLAVDRKSVV